MRTSICVSVLLIVFFSLTLDSKTVAAAAGPNGTIQGSVRHLARVASFTARGLAHLEAVLVGEAE